MTFRDHSVTVGFHVRGEPQGHGLKLAETPHRLGRERLATERAKECREVRQVAGRIWIHPANDRVCGERRDQDIERLLLLLLLAGR